MMLTTKLLPLTFSLLAYCAWADQPPTADLALEPCINGGVSATGLYPSQEMEKQIDAYLAWSEAKGEPFYLFPEARERLTKR